MIDVDTAGLVFAIVATGIATFSLRKNIQTKRQIESIFSGLEHGDNNLIDTIEKYFTQVKSTDAKLSKIQKNYQHLSRIAATSLQKTAIVRFNPFKNTGGDQSFALSLLDNHDSGFMLTSIHSREGTRVYIKPIRYGTSDHTLSKEELSALNAAMNRTQDTKGQSKYEKTSS